MPVAAREQNGSARGILECSSLRLEIPKLAPGKPAIASVGVAESVEAVRITNGKGAQHIGIEESKQRRIETERQRDDADHGDGECRRAEQAARRVAHIQHDGVEPGKTAPVAALLLHLREAAKLARGHASRIACVHACLQVFTRFHFEVKSQLLVQVPLGALREEESTQPKTHIGPIHLRRAPARGRWQRSGEPTARSRVRVAFCRPPSNGRSARGVRAPRRPIRR